MKLFAFLLLLPIFCFCQSKLLVNVNPTGSYKLNVKTITKGEDTYGYFGDIKVKRLNNSKIVLTLFVCKGAPSYNSGSIWDTLEFKNNKAVYFTEDDTTCRITFTFNQRGVSVEQQAASPNFACGFGHAVDAYGYYRKTSSKIPVIKDPAED
ncbi:MAG TPA: hypothetical protein VKH37_04045 [Ferruginibacter sp.]|nr:hypothetical protein [Ferruginibacter sp.]